jgi:HEPN domain-containing protein
MTETRDIAALWLERVEYDLDAAESMLRSGHLLYVAFLCQQAIEKALKAMWCSSRTDAPPFVHNLSTLAESLSLSLDGTQRTLLDRLTRYYIVGRYPTFKHRLASALTPSDAAHMLEQSREFSEWCRKSIPT